VDDRPTPGVGHQKRLCGHPLYRRFNIQPIRDAGFFFLGEASREAIGNQPSANSKQLSVISLQRSAVSHQASAVSNQPLTADSLIADGRLLLFSRRTISLQSRSAFPTLAYRLLRHSPGVPPRVSYD